MNDGNVAYLTAGRRFEVADITFWADPRHRTLDDALAEADLLVSCPDGTAEIPAELEPWVSPGLTREMQDRAASVVVRLVARRWAAIDPSIVYVENPHPPVVSRPDPSVLVAPDPHVLASVAQQGADVYRAARLQVLQQLAVTRSSTPHRPLTSVTLRDTPTPGEPAILSLSNRGDLAGNPLPQDPVVTMDPERLRLLADSHRTAFAVLSHDEVALNRPHRESREILETTIHFAAGPHAVDAVRAVFSREFLIGPDGDPRSPDPQRIEEVARMLRRSWLHYRTTVG